MSDTMKVLLGRVSTLEMDWIVDSSTKITADCGHLCWIARSTREAIKDHDGPVITECTECCGMDQKELIDKTNAGEIKAAPGGIDEINNHVGFNLTNLMEEYLRLREHKP